MSSTPDGLASGATLLVPSPAGTQVPLPIDRAARHHPVAVADVWISVISMVGSAVEGHGRLAGAIIYRF